MRSLRTAVAQYIDLDLLLFGSFATFVAVYRLCHARGQEDVDSVQHIVAPADFVPDPAVIALAAQAVVAFAVAAAAIVAEVIAVAAVAELAAKLICNLLLGEIFAVPLNSIELGSR